MSKENALKVIERLEGTLVADLKSLKVIAKERTTDKSLQDKMPGAFNFAIFLTGLVACETLGYFINKESQDGDTKKNIENFISSKYFNSPELNKRNYLDALVSLRTNLAHVYGMTDLSLNEVDKDLVLCVGGSSYPMIMSDQRKVKLNGIKFIELILKAFDSVKSEVSIPKNESDIARIINDKS